MSDEKKDKPKPTLKDMVKKRFEVKPPTPTSSSRG